MTVRPDPRPIAIATPRYAPEIGGVERHAEEHARGLVARGFAVEVLTTDPTGRLPRLERRDGVLIRRFPTLGGDSVFFISPRLARWFWSHADRYRLVHAHSYHTLVPMAAGSGARRAGVPLVITAHYHGGGHTPLRNLLHIPYRPVAGRILHAADSVITVSDAEAGWLTRDFGDLPIHVLPSGVGLADRDPAAPTPAPPPREPDEVTILSVGRLEAYKGVERTVAALPHLPPATRLVVIGKGPAADAIAATAERLGVRDRVRLLGHVTWDELEAWYSVADVFVTLSEDEAFGMTVLEAAAAGAPVVASAIPAHREVAGYVPADRITLIEPGTDGPALAAAIEATRARGRSTDRTGWRVPTWDGMVDGIVKVYEEVLDTPLP